LGAYASVVATPTASPQLTLLDLTTAQAQVPTATWGQLTAKQQRFVAALVRDPSLTYTAAAKLAGAKPSRAGITGTEWARDPKVKAALDTIRRTAEAKAESDLVYVKRRLKQNDRKAYKADDIGASNGALNLFAKVTGLTEKRVRITFDDPAAMLAQLKAMPIEERKRVILEMLSE